ncbi:hypothetical protein EW146_g7610 [Bondarzewia mesenterica]|uniref:DUF6699 domain-containing protein n=1 Tax=Bondarzewia mesenterica TaxID=1095465 RepID=A0A4S4LQY2_9AGAM|nr:hypothetical protein EW146_g7610 [Bondarzewia mesenterica]
MAGLYPGWSPYPYSPYYPFPPTPAAARRAWQAGGRSPGNVNAPLPPVAPPDYPPHPYEPFPRGRRHSFDGSYLHPNQWPLWNPPSPYHSPHHFPWLFAPPPLPQPQIHALLSGDTPTQYIVFDLSAHAFSAHRRINTSQTVPLIAFDLDQAATSPEILRLRIVCDAIPQWTLDLHVTGTTLHPRPRRERHSIPYITAGDILEALHTHLHKQVTHEEWGRLSSTQEIDVSRAYTRRHKSFPPMQQQQQKEGVKRVDYLLRNYYFKGLVWLSPDNGVERMKLLVGPP